MNLASIIDVVERGGSVLHGHVCIDSFSFVMRPKYRVGVARPNEPFHEELFTDPQTAAAYFLNLVDPIDTIWGRVPA